ncbi:hypothetical protein, partial [Rosistilla oblonga]|uniref:hypothetical protein n=1 Tax=Rosistilla oblonga TaxID=2527990 RepID=UPI003A973F4D
MRFVLVFRARVFGGDSGERMCRGRTFAERKATIAHTSTTRKQVIVSLENSLARASCWYFVLVFLAVIRERGCGADALSRSER